MLPPRRLRSDPLPRHFRHRVEEDPSLGPMRMRNFLRSMRQSLKVQTTDIDQKIGARIREFRLLRSMSQGALAEKLGITFQQLQKYEKGTNRVSVSALILICKELGITPNHILGAFFDNDEHSERVD